MQLALFVLLTLLLVGCETQPPIAGPEIRLTPDREDMIEVLLRSESVPMSVHPSCREVGDRFEVVTIGGYIASLLFSQTEGGKNWVDVTIMPDTSPLGEVWRATITFHSGGSYLDDEDRVEFLVLQSGGRVVPSSFRCMALQTDVDDPGEEPPVPTP